MSSSLHARHGSANSAFSTFSSSSVVAPPPAPEGNGPREEPAPSAFDALGRLASFPPGQTSLGRLLEVHKALWLPAGFAAMAFTGNWGMRPALMTGLFGAYGIVWVLKSNIYPDLGFYNTEKSRIKGAVDYAVKFAMIGVYFLYPYLAAANTATLHPLAAAASTLGFCLGGFFHWAGDAQRYFELKYNPNHLITDGFQSHVRHPSYLGEILMWLSLTTLSGPLNPMSWLPVAWLSMITLAVGIPEKEKSLSRYGKKFEEWRARVPALIPRLW